LWTGLSRGLLQASLVGLGLLLTRLRGR